MHNKSLAKAWQAFRVQEISTHLPSEQPLQSRYIVSVLQSPSHQWKKGTVGRSGRLAQEYTVSEGLAHVFQQGCQQSTDLAAKQHKLIPHSSGGRSPRRWKHTGCFFQASLLGLEMAVSPCVSTWYSPVLLCLLIISNESQEFGTHPYDSFNELTSLEAPSPTRESHSKVLGLRLQPMNLRRLQHSCSESSGQRSLAGPQSTRSQESDTSE